MVLLALRVTIFLDFPELTVLHSKVLNKLRLIGNLKCLSWFVTLLANKEGQKWYEIGSSPSNLDKCCDAVVEKASNDSLQLPAEDDHDIVQGNSDQGEFYLFFVKKMSICLLYVHQL